MFIASYIQTATHLFEQYALQMPLHLYLKEYFKQNKKFGSRDRKYISELVYGIYRLGISNAHLPVQDRLIIGSFLSGRLPKLFFEKIQPALALHYEYDFDAKMQLVQEEYQCQFNFPFECSEGLSTQTFIKSLFIVPSVFIRIRNNKKAIQELLTQQKINYKFINEQCISVDAKTRLDEILTSSDYVIQDISSQAIGNYLQPKHDEYWWDCCAASGGKSILLLDKNKHINLTATDIRASILKNLHTRMQLYGYATNYLASTLDLTQPIPTTFKQDFHHIICDAPCSGAGTWSRSPELYYFFTEEKLKHFTTLQYQIAENVLSKLKDNGSLIYITCSQLKQENEDIVHQFATAYALIIEEMKIIDHTNIGGDILFIAKLRRGDKQSVSAH